MVFCLVELCSTSGSALFCSCALLGKASHWMEFKGRRNCQLNVSTCKSALLQTLVYATMWIEYSWYLNVQERKVNLKELKSKRSHLSDLELPEVDGSQVTVLIGSDFAQIIVPLKWGEVTREHQLASVQDSGGTLLVVHLAISEKASLSSKFTFAHMTKSFMSVLAPGGALKILAASMTVILNILLKMREFWDSWMRRQTRVMAATRSHSSGRTRTVLFQPIES